MKITSHQPAFKGVVNVQGIGMDLADIVKTVGKDKIEYLNLSSAPSQVFARIYNVCYATKKEKEQLTEFKTKHGITTESLKELPREQRQEFYGLFKDVESVGQNKKMAIEILEEKK